MFIVYWLVPCCFIPCCPLWSCLHGHECKKELIKQSDIFSYKCVFTWIRWIKGYFRALIMCGVWRSELSWEYCLQFCIGKLCIKQIHKILQKKLETMCSIVYIHMYVCVCVKKDLSVYIRMYHLCIFVYIVCSYVCSQWMPTTPFKTIVKKAQMMRELIQGINPIGVRCINGELLAKSLFDIIARRSEIFIFYFYWKITLFDKSINKSVYE